MPEKPKRRKNKNKRKNKNNRADTNKIDSEVIENAVEESCSSQIVDEDILPQCDSNGILAASLINDNNVVENPVIPEVVCSDIVCVNEDFNNNSNTRSVESLQVPVPLVEDCNDENVPIQECDTYIVESPEQSLKCKPKLNNTTKSKSLDNDDATKIVEIINDVGDQSEEGATIDVIDTSNILVSDVESDVEWEKTDDLNNIEVSLKDDVATGTLSITTVPLNVALCEEINISLRPDVETSLRKYLRTLDLSTHPENVNSVEIKAEIEQIINREIRHRLRKKGLADDFGLQRLGPPRTLDVIDEEGSGESSKSSRRHSYLSDKKSDIEDLEDDVFEDKNKTQEKIARKTETTLHQKKTFGHLVPQQCMLVGAKIKEPEVTEARGDWTMQTVEKMTGAEVVYLTDSSSSTSSLHDYGEETDDGMDTDVSVRMITPTIEVTDTENLLKNTFISNVNNVNESNVKEHSNDKHISEINSDKNNHQNIHEIVVLSTDDIKTNLYVKDVEPPQLIIKTDDLLNYKTDSSSKTNEENIEKNSDKYDLEIKVLKCELNDAINNLIKEVSDSELNENSNETFTRQDSSSSVCSSQCTAKYNPTSSSLNDVSNILHDDNCDNNKSNTENIDSVGSHVKDVFDHVAGVTTEVEKKKYESSKVPSHLRDLCVKRIASFPYGDKILEELATVSKRIQNITRAFTTDHEDIKLIKIDNSKGNNMPRYPLPDISSTEFLILPVTCNEPVPPPLPVPPRNSSLKKTSREETILTGVPIKTETIPPIPIQPRNYSIKKISKDEGFAIKSESDLPPVPLQPRQSSLKNTSREEEAWTGVPTKAEPVYVCLSPSQKMLMEKTQTVITKEGASELAEIHKKYVDRRSYNETYTKDKDKDEKDNTVCSITPFKSQTGSRLLALIRDPTVTNSINNFNKQSTSEQLEKMHLTSQSTIAKHHRLVNNSNASTFKPIPPPRPKKISSSFYEGDESSDFTDCSMRSMKSERKFFHFSTGNLNKDIEDDILSIQNMHRYYTNTRDSIKDATRRPSLPKDLCDQQMEYIRQKEKEVEAEIQRLESLRKVVPSITQPSGPSLISEKEVTDAIKQRRGPRAPLVSEKEQANGHFKDSNNFFISKRRDFFASLSGPEERGQTFSNHNFKIDKGKLLSAFSSSQEELLREKMYSEYVTQMAQREERKQHKMIKITNTPTVASFKPSKSLPSIDLLESKVNNRIEKEFISKARERWDKLGIKDPETEDERDTSNEYREPKIIEHKIKVIEGGREKDMKKLPSHLQEFVRFTAKDEEPGTESSSGESKSEPASPHVMIWCAVVIIILAVGKYFLRLIRNR